MEFEDRVAGCTLRLDSKMFGGCLMEDAVGGSSSGVSKETQGAKARRCLKSYPGREELNSKNRTQRKRGLV